MWGYMQQASSVDAFVAPAARLAGGQSGREVFRRMGRLFLLGSGAGVLAQTRGSGAYGDCGGCP